MSRFHGPQPGFKTGTTKGVIRAYKARKRKEAEERAKKKFKEIIDSQEEGMVDSQA